MAWPKFRQWVAMIIGDGHSGSGEKFAVETQSQAVEAADVLLLQGVDRIRNPQIRWQDKGMPGMRPEQRVDLIQDRMRDPILTRSRNGADEMGQATVFIGEIGEYGGRIGQNRVTILEARALSRLGTQRAPQGSPMRPGHARKVGPVLLAPKALETRGSFRIRSLCTWRPPYV